jgi:hypothetical protein
MRNAKPRYRGNDYSLTQLVVRHYTDEDGGNVRKAEELHIRASATWHMAALQAATKKLGSYYMFGCLKHRLQLPRGGVEDVTAQGSARPRGNIHFPPVGAQPADFAFRPISLIQEFPIRERYIPQIPADFAETVCSLDTVSGIGTECTFVTTP